MARQFIETVMIGKAFDRLSSFINAQDYVEHNPRLGDDIALLQAELERRLDDGFYTDYQKLHRVLAQGNFVLCVTEGLSGGAHTAFYDLFRMAHGKIVEHWDTTETVAPKSEWKNNNGKF